MIKLWSNMIKDINFKLKGIIKVVVNCNKIIIKFGFIIKNISMETMPFIKLGLMK